MAEGGVARGRLAPVQPLSSPDAMGVVAPRLVFLAFVGLTGSIIYNALYLQDLHGTAAVTASGQVVPAPERRPPIELVQTPAGQHRRADARRRGRAARNICSRPCSASLPRGATMSGLRTAS